MVRDYMEYKREQIHLLWLKCSKEQQDKFNNTYGSIGDLLDDQLQSAHRLCGNMVWEIKKDFLLLWLKTTPK